MMATAVAASLEQTRPGRCEAEVNGLRYQPTDDGTAREFAADLDGIGQFYSPSLGDVVPRTSHA